ncbi:conserved hypothetical protein [Prochlorococcus marinus str. MIT 9312]|uniref:DUF3119 domain-containing protein n=1 Tax=Prochlorococcus marinus (strain MIT 9312) TaxID=74546 RepID=Q319G2_PROM9|nr:DUF3119 family protein [Prochlorococcus marinus]ABB50483.1 conserved hypothetical protein [Prochlorococcus marinus str. MIT 9312]
MFNTKSKKEDSVIISPSFQLPVIVIFLSFMLLFLNIGSLPTIVCASFSFFLLLQSFTLRIKITNDDFIVLQLGKEIRTFPFKNWISWKFFFPSIPGIFYFREKSSPHLLPILFNPKQLKDELLKKVDSLEIKNS